MKKYFLLVGVLGLSLLVGANLTRFQSPSDQVAAVKQALKKNIATAAGLASAPSLPKGNQVISLVNQNLGTAPGDFLQPEADSFIVQLKEPSLLETKNGLQKASGDKFTSFVDQLSSQASKIKAQKTTFKSHLKIGQTVKSEFKNVFNGLEVNLNKKDLASIKALPEVKAIYPNNKVRAFLDQSVPLIGADQVWSQNAQGQNCVASATSTSTYTVALLPSTGGTINVAPVKSSYNAGDQIRFTPSAGSGYKFTGWTGDFSGTNLAQIVTISKNMTVGATFEPMVVPPTSYKVTYNVDPPGSGLVTGSVYASAGTQSTYTAYPAVGYAFHHWSGSLSSSANPAILSMDGNKNLTANFAFVGTTTPPSSPCLTGQGVKIAIVDTGIDYTHPDLGACASGSVSSGQCKKVAGGYDFINDDADPMDDMGHGTHVASIAAGNGLLKGVAPDATLYAYKVLDSGGSGSFATVIAGIDRAVDPNGDGNFSDRADVINLSLGGSGDPDDPVSQAVDQATAAGVAVAVAAGNSGSDYETIGSPGLARGAITVAATDKSKYVAYFSSRGPVHWLDNLLNDHFLMKPDVSAPGVDICGAEWGEAWSDSRCKDNKHVSISGTSMATPHVAGAIALLRQKNPTWDPEEVKMALRGSVDLSAPSHDHYTTGSGFINVPLLIASPRPPVALLSDVVFHSDGVIDFVGTATAQSASSTNFLKNYSVQYATNGNVKGGGDPTVFTTITTQATPVAGGTLLGGFDTKVLDDGDYTVRLVATNKLDKTSEDRTIIRVNNFAILSVGSTLNYVNGGLVPINGFINLPGVSQYKVESNLDQHEGDPKTLLCTGAAIGKEGALCTGNFSQLPDGKYDLYLSVLQNGVWKTDLPFKMVVSKELLTGWPQKIDGFPAGQHLVDDFNHELIVPHYLWCRALGGGWSECSGSKWYFYNTTGLIRTLANLSDGSLIPSLFFSQPTLLPGSASSSPNSILIGQDRNIVNFDNTGHFINSWPVNPNGQLDGQLVSDPIVVPSSGGDGSREIIGSSFNFSTGLIKLQRYSSAGVPAPDFPVSLPLPSLQYEVSGGQVVNLMKASSTTMVLISGDFNEGSEGGWKLNLYANFYSVNGKQLKRVLLYGDLSRSVVLQLTNMAVTDYNGDGSPEVVIGYSIIDSDFPSDMYNPDHYKTYVKIFDMAGNLEYSLPEISGYTIGKIVIGDLGQSSPSPIILLDDTWSTGNQRLIALKPGGQKLFDIPIDNFNDLETQSLVADTNGDGAQEILVAYRPRWFTGGNSGIKIFNSNGGLIQNLVLPTLGVADDISPVITDFDSDGKADVVLQSYYLPINYSTALGEVRFYPLRLSGAYDPAKVSWGTYLKDNQHSATFLFPDTSTTTTTYILTTKVSPTGSGTISGNVSPYAAGAIATLTATSSTGYTFSSWSGCVTATSTDCNVVMDANKTVTATFNPPAPTSVSLFIKRGPSLSLQYDSGQHEAALVADFKVVVGAQNGDISFSKNGAFGVAANSSQSSHGGSSVVTSDSSNAGDTSDLFTISANTARNFDIVTTFNVLQMFAGTYAAQINGLYISSLDQYLNLSGQDNNQTNSVAIVGEKSPYITWVDLAKDSSLMIKGERLSQVTQAVIETNQGGRTTIDRADFSDFTDASFSISSAKLNLPAGDYRVYLISPTGDSNRLGFQISACAAADVNKSGKVDNFDALFVRGRLGCDVAAGDPNCAAADVNKSGKVDNFDFLSVRGQMDCTVGVAAVPPSSQTASVFQALWQWLTGK